MSVTSPATVFIHRLALDGESELNQDQLAEATGRLVKRLRISTSTRDRWGLKVQLGSPGLPALVDPRWAAGAVRGLGPVSGHFAFDTLSITQEGLHTVEAQLTNARAKGFGSDFVVADDPQLGLPKVFESARLAAAAAQPQGLLLLSTIQSHPHLGFLGAVSGLGLGLSDREGKLELHRDIRPQVDTPLCAGCGSCLDVCIFDAIEIKAGRAMIDHARCVGCGECMTVCHMAGISAEEASAIPVFQRKVAVAGATFARDSGWGKSGKAAYFNYLVNLDRRKNRSGRRNSPGAKHLGVLASTDPVALDRATWDLMAEYAGGSLSIWTGYLQEPGALLETASELGLGTPEYKLVEAG